MNRVVVLIALASLSALASAGAQTVGENPAPGTYHHAVVLALKPPRTGQELYYRVAIDGTQQTKAPAVRYSVPLYLTALPGMQRTYRITVETREGGRVVQTDQSVWVVDRTRQAPATPAQGEPSSRTSSSPATASPPTSIPILSPVSGTFGNEQLLFIDRRGFSWIRYTLDGSDPTEGGALYTHPVILPKTGTVEVKVAALARGTSRPLTAEVSYRVKQGAASPLLRPSGVAADPFAIAPPANGSYYYTLQDQTPDASDLPFDRPLEIGAPPGSVEYTVLRLRARSSAGAWGPDFRYFFAVDRRPAPPPSVELLGGTIATPRTRVRIEDAPYTKIYYTTDGSAPTPAASRYSKPFTPELPPESAGTITIRARAYAPNGTKSKPVDLKLPFTTKTPHPPKVTLEQRTPGQNGGRLLRVEVPKGSVAVFERTMDGSTPADPTVASPRATGDMLLSAPRGASVLFSLRFATVDATGAISPPTKTFAIRVNEVPPPEPAISFADGKLTIRGRGSLRYTLTRTGAPPKTPGPDAHSYTGPVPLAGSTGARTEYRVAAVAVAADGLRSSVVRGGPYVVDRRSPALPVYWGVAPGGIYNDARTLSVETRPGGEVHYTLSTDGGSPKDPTAASPVFGAAMQFSVPDGASKSYVVKLRETIDGRPGPVATIPFTIDRIPPSVPPLEGIGPSEIVNHPVTLDPPKPPAGESLFISLSTKGRPGDPLGNAGRPFDAPLRLNDSAGQELTYHLRLGARDRAGNTAEGATTYRVTIDRTLPPAPAIRATPPGGTAGGEVSLAIGSGGPDTYRYEMTDNGSDPPLPTAHSPRYRAPIELKPVDGRPTLYTVLATAEDAAGNLSPAPSVYRVLVTPSGTATAQAPGRASRSGPAAGSSSPRGTAASSTAGPQAAPAGAAAPKTAQSLPKRLLGGAKNGGLYNSAVTLTPPEGGGIVRYEIASDGGVPAAVTRFSPELSTKLVVEPAPGGVRHYAVRAALFAAAASSSPLESETLGFTIDRQPPPQPHISGITNDARYQQQETFSLHAASGTIYYSLDKLTPFVSSGSLSSTKYMPYTGPVTIGAGETSARYRIHAYTLDKAGNRSRVTPEWTVYFDRGVVYVSPTGTDANDGTSTHPVKTLRKALELAHKGRRGTIFLAAGSYTLDHAYRITSGVSILGDFNPKDWHQSSKPGSPATSVRVSAAAGGPCFSIDGGGLSIEDIALSAGRGGSLVDLQRGALSVSNSLLSADDAARAVVEAVGGSLSLNHVSIENRAGGPDISASGSARVSANGGTFAAGETGGDSVLVDLGKGTKASISDSLFRPTAGLRTYSIRAEGADLTLEGSTLDSGVATRQAVALYAAHSKVELTDTKISASADSHMSFGVQAQGSTITVTGSTISAAGSVGATGIWAESSHLRILQSRLRGAPTSEFLYLVKLTDSTAEISSTILEGSTTGDFLGIGLTRSPAKIVGNTIYGGSGSDHSAAILLADSPKSAIVDNILSRREKGVGRAISIGSGSTIPVIVANDFAGYPVLLAGPGVPELTSVGALNRIVAAGRSGNAPGNITEPAADTFGGNGDLHLKRDSACIGAGVDPAPYGGVAKDLAGAPRAAPYDIGALRHR